MNIRQLREAIKDLPGDLEVRIVPPTNDDEWSATFVTFPSRTPYVLICANNLEHYGNEIVLHDDEEG